MKHIEDFNINEKISWKSFLIIMGMTFAGKYLSTNISAYKNMNYLYNQVNSEKSVPTGDDKKKIEDIRQELILDIESSNLFQKSKKSWIIDSIKSIEFKIIDDRSIRNISGVSTNGCYIYIAGIKDKFPLANKFSNQTSLNNVIILNSDLFSNPNSFEIIQHELYHYLDQLIGKDNEKLSSNIDFGDFLDSEIDNDIDYAVYKYTAIYCKSTDGISKEKKRELEEMVKDEIKSSKSYITSQSELFARWKTFKSKLKREGYIKNINQRVDRNLVIKYCQDKLGNIYIDDVSLLFYLKLSKIEELDKLVN